MTKRSRAPVPIKFSESKNSPGMFDRKNQMKLMSIVVPVYNEKESLPTTVSALAKVGRSIVEQMFVGEVEFIYVDDGSHDGSAATILGLKTENECSFCRIHVLQFSRNFGHSAAVLAGLRKTKGDYVAIIDADLQDPPEALIGMLRKLNEDQLDVVYGKRVRREGETIQKKITAWLFYRFLSLTSGFAIPRDSGDFRVITGEVRDAICKLDENEPFIRGLVAWVGFKQGPYEYVRHKRLLGETKYSWVKMFRFATNAILSFSSLPLTLAIYIGIFGFLVATTFAFYALLVWSFGNPIPGWTSLVIGFAFGQSVTLFLIGVMGLYLGRAFEALKSRPKYIIRKTIR